MNALLTPEHIELLTSGNLAHVATVDISGRPRSVMTWIDYSSDNQTVLLNTPLTSIWGKNLRRTGQVDMTVADSGAPHRYIRIAGDLTDTIEGDQARAHIDGMALRYLNQPTYPFGRAPRALMHITPRHLRLMG